MIAWTKTNIPDPNQDKDLKNLKSLQDLHPMATEEFQEQLGMQSFVNGLWDAEIQRSLWVVKFKKNSNALIWALETGLRTTYPYQCRRFPSLCSKN